MEDCIEEYLEDYMDDNCPLYDRVRCAVNKKEY